MVEAQTSTHSQKDKLITILGPTASGKTSRAVSLARHIDAEIISADSRQVYKGMDIGTGKDLSEYGDIIYHIIDICNAGEKYNLHKYLNDFRKSLDAISDKGKKAILCGGTGLYLETALSGIHLPEVPENPELRKQLEGLTLDQLSKILSEYKTLHNTTDIDTAKRALRAIEIEEYYRTHPHDAIESRRENVSQIPSLIIGIDVPRDIRRERITRRLNARLDAGMVEEVIRLLESGIMPEDLIYYGLEYKFLTLYVIGKISYQEMVKELEIAIHQFAKRQMTWFRGMEKRGFKIHWLPYDLDEKCFIDEVVNLTEKES